MLPCPFFCFQTMQYKLPSLHLTLANLFLITHILPIVRTQTSDSKVITIGAILSNQQYAERFTELVRNLTAPEGYVYRGVYIIASNNPVNTATDICDQLLPEQVMWWCDSVALSGGPLLFRWNRWSLKAFTSQFSGLRKEKIITDAPLTFTRPSNQQGAVTRLEILYEFYNIVIATGTCC